jgi:hypothetical protein
MSSKKSVFCIASDESEAFQITDRLKAAGFRSSDVSILFPDKSGSFEKRTKAPEGAKVGAGSGLVVGGALGWLAGVGSLTIPGAGPFIAAGPVMAVLGGAAVGGAVGGVTGALVGLGMSESEAKQYEGRLREGNVLVSVHSENGDEVARAKSIFKECDADAISVSGETRVQKTT